MDRAGTDFSIISPTSAEFPAPSNVGHLASDREHHRSRLLQGGLTKTHVSIVLFFETRSRGGRRRARAGWLRRGYRRRADGARRHAWIRRAGGAGRLSGVR